jgi:3-hydroxyethyl bacteriochlorophyllide a dehydrogenase
MKSLAVVLEQPQRLALSRLDITSPGDEDAVVAIEWSGVSTGTERLLWLGRMPHFPGMGYPLVPGYESIGRVIEAGARSGRRVGERVFVPGARCFGDVRGLFGGSASHVTAPAAKLMPLDERIGEEGVLLALAATALHALCAQGARPPQLIVGHGVFGRLLARLTILRGAPAPTVWERNPLRAGGAEGYCVIRPEDDDRRDYASIYDASGDAALLDALMSRLALGGEIALAGFYSEPISFAFPPAFMREARLRVAAQWQPEDLATVARLVEEGRLSLDGLITHRRPAAEAAAAYPTAFDDASCLKLILDWRDCS